MEIKQTCKALFPADILDWKFPRFDIASFILDWCWASKDLLKFKRTIYNDQNMFLQMPLKR